VSDKPIQAGDLVAVVRVDHDCAGIMLGRIYRVNAIPFSHPGICCPTCRMRDIEPANGNIALVSGRKKEAAVPFRWLKATPHLDELAGDGTHENPIERA